MQAHKMSALQQFCTPLQLSLKAARSPNGTTVFHKQECKTGHLVAVDAKMSLSAGEKTETARKINKYTMLVFHTFTKSEMAKVSELTC